MIFKRYVALIVFCVIGPIAYADKVEVKTPQTKIISSDNGRFVFGQVSDFRSDQFLLDTKTGRLWQIVKDKKDRTLLQPVPIIQLIFGDEAYIPDTDDEVLASKNLARKQTIDEWQKSNQHEQAPTDAEKK